MYCCLCRFGGQPLCAGFYYKECGCFVSMEFMHPMAYSVLADCAVSDDIFIGSFSGGFKCGLGP